MRHTMQSSPACTIALALLALVIGSGAVTAGERKLTGPEIEAMLADVTVTGKAAKGH